MTYNFATSPERSLTMSKIKSKDTKSEIMLRQALWHNGYRYRKNYKDLPGSPDIAITRYKIAIFIDGEFWHGYKWHEKKGKIKDNRDYWVPKIERNIKRDKKYNKELKNMGWKVLRLWSMQVEKDLKGCLQKIEKEVRKQTSKYKIASLFSGCGGLDLGFKNSGFNVAWANDNDEHAWRTYEYNHPGAKLCKKSITEIKEDEIPEVDGFIGGPPCQSWSLAGSMGGVKDSRGKVFYEYVRLLSAKKPKFFLVENVPGMLSKTHKTEFQKLLKFLEQVGYEVTFKKLNSKYYSVPQERERVIIVGYRKDLGIEYKFPRERNYSKDCTVHKSLLGTDEFPPILSLKDTIGDLPEPLPAKKGNKTNGSELEVDSQEYYIGGFSSRYMSRNRRKSWEEPAYTIQASGRHANIHPSAAPMIKLGKDEWKFDENSKHPYRRFSIRESARIQTFPDDFKFFYTNLDAGYKIVGNAVPPKLAEILADRVYRDLDTLNQTFFADVRVAAGQQQYTGSYLK